ncbi:MAG: VWA domain-containing protein [Hyphomicrobium sp.]
MSRNALKWWIAASPGQPAGTTDGGIARRPSKMPAAFIRDASGDIAMVFGLMATVMFGLIGSAVDMGRWLNARDQTIAAIDAAVLAGGRVIQAGGTVNEATEAAMTFYQENIKNRIPLGKSPHGYDSIEFTVTSDNTVVKAIGEAKIETPILGILSSILGLPKSLPLLNMTEAPEARVAIGQNADTNLEIAMMLDVSGSMCSPCTKRDDMKAAAKDLVNILVWDTQGAYTSKVAIVPFSGDVRPPTGMLSLIQNPAWPTTRSKSYTSKGKTKTATYTKTACVAERAGTNKYTNVLPVAGSYINNAYTDDGACSTPASGSVMPMSSSKSALIAKIDGLATGGGTAGHLGTAWAYYMLSNTWASRLTGESVPVAFGTAKTKKIAILMTDGEYNYTYDSTGVAVGENGAGSSVNGSTAAQQAVSICSQMKDKGIEVYTVGFDLGNNSTAINTLHDCATDESHAYIVDDGEALKQAFRDIAIKVTDLHLAK